MLKRHWGMLATAAIFATGPAGAQTAGDTRQIDRLEGQIQALQREVGDLKQKALTAEKNTYAAAPAPGCRGDAAGCAPTAIATMSPNYRPSICTPDQLNCISLTGVLQFDFGGYNYRPATGLGIAATGVPVAPSTVPQQLDDGVNVRRGRIGVLGKFMGDWNYALIYDFGNSSDGFGGLAPGSLPGGGISGIENAYLSYTGFKAGSPSRAATWSCLIRSTSPPAPTTSCSWSARRPRSSRPTSRPATFARPAASAATMTGSGSAAISPARCPARSTPTPRRSRRSSPCRR